MKKTQLILAMLTKDQLLVRSIKELPIPLLHAAVRQLLGDAYADKSSPTSNTRLSWSFGSAYETYAQYIVELFGLYCNIGLYSVTAQAKKDGVSYVNYRLKTATLPIFNMLHAMFYVLDPLTNKYVYL